jgi:uncharacterized protein
MRVAITGATGLVGSKLVEKLLAQGDEVLVLTRNASIAQAKFPQAEVVQYRPLESGDWQKSIEGCVAVVNLAGEPIAEKKWTVEQKKIILESRELGTKKIVEAIEQATVKPQVLINASAIGYYGASETATFDESSSAGNDFLAEICQKWEAAAQASTIRTVVLRFGIVLGKDGGALAKMIPAFKMFVGGPIGTGNQWFSWVQIDDVVGMILVALQDGSMSGTFNATAPQPVKMKDLCTQLGAVMARPSWMPVPGFVLETMLGEGATVVLDGQQVLPKGLLDRGFNFQYADLAAALRVCL